MKTKYLIAYGIAGILMCFLAGCGDDNTYAPGPETTPNTPAVYFDKETPALFSVPFEEEDKSGTIAVCRLNTDNKLTVPITVIHKTDEISFPESSVTFEAGEDMVYFKFLCRADADIETRFPFVLEIPHEYADPYNSTIPGASMFNGFFLIEEPWVKFEATVEFVALAEGAPAFTNFKQTVGKKEKAGIYKIFNFCLNGRTDIGEQTDFQFTVNPENKNIVPDPNYGWHGYPGDGAAPTGARWYFYLPHAQNDGDTSARIIGYLPGAPGEYFRYFYFYTSGSNREFWWDDEAKTAEMRGYSRYVSASQGQFKLVFTWE